MTALLLGAAAMIALMLWLPNANALASSHSAERSFPATWAAPGAEFEVTVTLREYGAFGQLVETLPNGFEYLGSNLNAAKVERTGQKVTFTLLGNQSVTYIVRAPETEGMYTFSGVLTDQGRDTRTVGGATVIRIGPAPTPTPVTPTATPTPAPERTATPTPEPTNTPTPEQAATAAPTPAATGASITPTPTSAPEQEPTATTTAAPPATLTPTPTAVPSPGQGGEATVILVLAGLGILVLLGGAALLIIRRRSRL